MGNEWQEAVLQNMLSIQKLFSILTHSFQNRAAALTCLDFVQDFHQRTSVKPRKQNCVTLMIVRVNICEQLILKRRSNQRDRMRSETQR